MSVFSGPDVDILEEGIRMGHIQEDHLDRVNRSQKLERPLTFLARIEMFCPIKTTAGGETTQNQRKHL